MKSYKEIKESLFGNSKTVNFLRYPTKDGYAYIPYYAELLTNNTSIITGYIFDETLNKIVKQITIDGAVFYKWINNLKDIYTVQFIEK